jgi:hypothetical protein
VTAITGAYRLACDGCESSAELRQFVEFVEGDRNRVVMVSISHDCPGRWWYHGAGVETVLGSGG